MSCYNKIKPGDHIEVGWDYSENFIKPNNYPTLRIFVVSEWFHMFNGLNRPTIWGDFGTIYVYPYEIKKIIKKQINPK